MIPTMILAVSSASEKGLPLKWWNHSSTFLVFALRLFLSSMKYQFIQNLLCRRYETSFWFDCMSSKYVSSTNIAMAFMHAQVLSYMLPRDFQHRNLIGVSPTLFETLDFYLMPQHCATSYTRAYHYFRRRQFHWRVIGLSAQRSWRRIVVK